MAQIKASYATWVSEEAAVGMQIGCGPTNKLGFYIHEMGNESAADSVCPL